MAIALVELFAGMLIGFILGLGGAIFYLRWKMQKQIGSIEDQMGAIMDMSEEMSGMMGPEEVDMDLEEESEERKEED